MNLKKWLIVQKVAEKELTRLLKLNHIQGTRSSFTKFTNSGRD